MQLMNFETSWWSLRNVLEYYFWFRSRLHFHAKSKFIPLGGNTVFVTEGAPRLVGGLGCRTASPRTASSVCGSPATAPGRRRVQPRGGHPRGDAGPFTSLLKQRTRWNQGFMQVLGKGDWKEIRSRRRRLLARYTLCKPFLQAFTGLAIPMAFASVKVPHPPVGLSLLSFLPLLPTVAILVFELVGLHEFGRLYHVRPRTSTTSVC